MPGGQSEGANVRKQPKPWDSQRERQKRERQLSGCGPAHLHWRQGGRQETARVRRQGANSAPETASPTELRAGPQLLTKSSWDPGQLTSARRFAARGSAPQRRLMAKQSGWTGETVRRTAHLRRRRVPSTWSSEMLRPGKGTECGPNRACAFVEYPRT